MRVDSSEAAAAQLSNYFMKDIYSTVLIPCLQYLVECVHHAEGSRVGAGSPLYLYMKASGWLRG